VRHSLGNARIDVLILEAGNRDYNVVESAPLLTRAWAYQERLLSPRSVNFHSAELTWDCGNGFDCECGQLFSQEPADDFDRKQVVPKYFLVGIESLKATMGEISTTWLDIVKNFSQLKLTSSKDKLPALAGIASRFANRLQSEYLVGIWWTDVGRGLLWRVDFEPREDMDARHSVRANSYRAPTWSWASIDLVENRPCSVWIGYGFLAPHFELDVLDKRFEVLDWKCDISGSNPYGCVMDGHLLVKGAALATTLFYDGSRTDSDDEYEVHLMFPYTPYDWHLDIQPNLDLFYYDFDIRGEGDSYP